MKTVAIKLHAVRHQLWLGTIVAAILLVAVATFLAEGPPRGPAPAVNVPDAAKLTRLPAGPADIENHGAAAISVLAPDAARRANDAVPFAPGPLLAAKPFSFSGSDEDRARAIECLASAELYEAGDNARGEAAVAQVVLNRVHHPAFPVTICGVVYQGAERSTGCQFTFTCDGSLDRTMPDAAWRRAREVAERALGGDVDKDVGLATHYHTDWVYPYWSPELRKLARVGSHLFFGWPGNWGGRTAFLRSYRGGEPTFAAVASSTPVAPASPTASQAADAAMLKKPDQPLPGEVNSALLFGNRLRLIHPDGGAFGLLISLNATPQQLTKAALALCPGAGFCRVEAWANDADIPKGFAIPPSAREKIVFEFVRDPLTSGDRVRFDCKRFPQVKAEHCR